MSDLVDPDPVPERAPSLWRHGDFVKLWVGQTVSLGGSLVGRFAIPLVAVLTLALFNVGAYVSAIAGLPETATSLGKLLGWAMVFVAITVALDLLYYLAPDAKLPFKWITPGGFIATVLLFVSDGALSYYVANLGNYGQIYGQLGAVIVFMLWLYVTGLMVLVGLEINAVLARVAEEKKGIELVQTKQSGHGGGG